MARVISKKTYLTLVDHINNLPLRNRVSHLKDIFPKYLLSKIRMMHKFIIT